MMHSFFREIQAQMPLIQAPMAGAQDAVLAIEVARSGGVGSIPCAASTAQEVMAAAAQFQAATNGPLNLNFFCHTPPNRDPQREAAWVQELSGFYDDLSVVPDYPTTGLPRPLDAAMVDAVCAIKPAVVSFHFGLPAEDFVGRIRATGAKIIATATTAAEAVFLEKNGCDAIIAQSEAAGGHQGAFLPVRAPDRLPTLQLVPRIVAALGNTPVIAAGGIADAATIREIMGNGASGVQVGTRFLKAPESTIAPLHRAILTGSQDRETAITNVFTGRPARGFVNKLVREIGPINRNAQVFPLAISALAPLKSATAGREDFVSMWAGENWKIGDAKPAADILADLAQGFEAAPSAT